MASAYANTNGSYGHEQYNATANDSQYAENGNQAENPSPLEKDQVGWFFVERYYSVLSEHPDQLHLFYNKKSLFIYGNESEVLPVLVGRQAIQARIQELDFSGSKIRIENVDSQETEGESIVVQVIGEIYNNTTEQLKKFVQTFVLAKQAKGYFVRNDIFRSIKGAEEDEETTAAPEETPVAADESAAPVEEPKVEPVQEPKTAVDPDALEQKLEEEKASEAAAEAPVTNGNGVSAEVEKPEEAAAAATEPAVSKTPEVAEAEVEEETRKEEETPKDPSPTPIAPPTAPAKPVEPVVPAVKKPFTWATMAANGAQGARPTIPAVPTKPVTQPPAQPRAAAPPAGPTPSGPASQQPAAQASESGDKNSDEWENVSGTRKARPQSVAAPAKQDETLGYVRNVSEKVGPVELKAALAKCGELVYFDINRGKNCAFVEFANVAGYNAAVAANPHIVNDEKIIVEPRRPKTGAYGGSGYNNNNRGAMNNRGRGNFEQGRPGSQGGRGAFAQRGRGVGGAPRGTGQRPAGQTAA